MMRSKAFFPAPNSPCPVLIVHSLHPSWTDLADDIADYHGCSADDLTTDELVWGDDGYGEFVWLDGRPIGSLNSQLTPADWQDAFAALAQPRLFNAAA